MKLSERRVVSFAEFREATIDRFLTCPLCSRQEFFIHKSGDFICCKCDCIVRACEGTAIVEFKNE